MGYEICNLKNGKKVYISSKRANVIFSLTISEMLEDDEIEKP